MKNTLIIPDIHLRWEQAEKIISAVGPDEVIFLGDYFDDFGDTPEMVRDTAEWLEGSVNKPNRIHLYGNHDQSYGFPFLTFKCSGYEQWKDFTINDIVSKTTWNKLKWYHWLDDRWLLTHAGLHRSNVPKEIYQHINDRPKFIEELSKYLDKSIEEGIREAANNTRTWIFNAGHSRGGSQKVGGITWCDYEVEFEPIIGINQIFGHTPLRHVCWTTHERNKDKQYPPAHSWNPTIQQLDNKNLSSNLCLDCRGNTHYAVWNGTNLIIGDYKSL